MSDTSRRAVLAGAAGVTAAVALAACGSDDGGADDTAAGEPTDGGAAGSGGAAGTALGSVAGIPVGGGKVFSDQKVVVTQPKAGQFKAFSAVCTHQGCVVRSVSDGTINCPCHGSSFSATDGSVVGGPAPTGLPSKKVTVDGDQISLA